MYAGVPSIAPVCVRGDRLFWMPGASFAMPKSSTFAWPSSVTRMLSGLRSRWTMPIACAAASADSTSVIASTTPPIGALPPTTNAASVLPSTNSITMYGRLSDSCARSRIFTMHSWEIRFTARASVKNRSRMSGMREH